MIQMNLTLSTLCTFEIKKDPLITALCGIFSGEAEKSLNAYSRVVNILLSQSITLGEYLTELLLYSENKVIEEYIATGYTALKKAVSYDVEVIREIAGVSASEIKNYLFEKYGQSFIILAPEYVKGKFVCDADYIIDHVRNNGSGIFAEYKSFMYTGGELRPVKNPDSISLRDLKRYEYQREQIMENTRYFVNGLPANNALLYGDRGTGKSSTVKAVAGEFNKIRLIQIDKSEIVHLFDIYEMVKNVPLKFIIFIDDLTFSEDDEVFGVFKHALEGSLTARPENVLIYATTNRRHILKETNSYRTGDELHRSDAIDEAVSLSDRFGLYVTFTAPDKELYLDIVLQIAADKGIKLSKEELCAGAERFALKKGGRSPRAAKQYADMIFAEENLFDK